MKKILSLFIALSIFALAQTSVLAQKASPFASSSATPLVTLFSENTSSPSPTVKSTIKPQPAQASANKIFSSMPKASFVVLFVVLLALIIELFILKSKKESAEKISKVTPEASFVEPAKNNKNKVLLSLLILVLLMAAIPLTLILVKQRQEVRKKATEPTICCEVWAKNKCSAALDSVDMKVAEYTTEAACNAYKQNPPSYSYSCNCEESCTTGGGHDSNQACPDSTIEANKTGGKATCSTSGSDNFVVRIINQGACGGVPTQAPTAPPTVPPTTPPTVPPTARPTTPPTTPPTTAPTPVVTSTPIPPTSLSCNQGPCNVANSGCTSGLVCVHDTWFGHDQWVCRNNDCQIESDCVCKQAITPPAPTNPPVGGPGQTARPYIPGPVPSPTIQVPVIPQAGIDGPTLATVAIGALLLIAGLALAL